jgi:hypothetical protein
VPEEYLTTREFTRWAEQFDKRLEASLGRVDDHAGRLAVLEDRSETDREERRQFMRRGNGAAGVIATLVSGIIAGLAALSHK